MNFVNKKAMKKSKFTNFMYAANLAYSQYFPEYVVKQKEQNPNFSAVLRIIKKNKIAIANFNQWSAAKYSEFFKSHEFKSDYRAEYKEMKNLKQEWAKIRHKFNDVKIENIFIKSIGHFPYKSSNLDVLIKQKMRNMAESILKDLGYVQLHNVEEPYKTLFRKFENGKSISAIHLHDKIAWINSFHDENYVWRRYKTSSKDYLVNIPSPEDSILILTAHWFYEDKQISLSDLLNISSCLKENEVDWDYMIYIAKKYGWLKGFYTALILQSVIEKKLYGKSIIQKQQIKKFNEALPLGMHYYFKKKVFTDEIYCPLKLSKIYCKILHLLKTVNDQTKTIMEKVKELFLVMYGSIFVILFKKFKINIRPQFPMLISISGVDGSGKTTYAEMIHDKLEFCELRTKVVWSRIGSSNFIKPFSKTNNFLCSFLKNMSRFFLTEKVEILREDQRYNNQEIMALRFLKPYFLMVEILAQYFFKVTLSLFFNKIVICDRYIYDSLIDLNVRYGLNLRSTSGRLFIFFITALTPKPDIAFVLLTSKEEACKRKVANSAERIIVNDQVILYNEIAKRFNLFQINSDNSTCITGNFDKMIHEIFKKYYKKWT